jgi:hypothetical protein
LTHQGTGLRLRDCIADGCGISTGDSDEVDCAVSIGVRQIYSNFQFTMSAKSGAILDWNLTLSDPEPISLCETDFCVSVAWTESSTKAKID